jgi:hypothetical protein
VQKEAGSAAEHLIGVPRVTLQRYGGSGSYKSPTCGSGVRTELRQSRGMQQMSGYACRRNLPSDLDQRRHVALARDVASDEWDESRL